MIFQCLSNNCRIPDIDHVDQLEHGTKLAICLMLNTFNNIDLYME